jgi:dihydroorotate dehydrogenase
MGASTPDGAHTAGIGGGRLHTAALDAVRALMDARKAEGCHVDVVGCGGVMDAASYHAYQALNVRAVQYYSAVIYRSPLAAAIIQQEAGR